MNKNNIKEQNMQMASGKEQNMQMPLGKEQNMQMVYMQVPCMQIPFIQMPNMQMPNMQVTSMQVPCMQVPCMQVPCIQVPCMQMTSMQMTSMQVPSMQVPSMQVPSMQVPYMQVPYMQMPAMLTQVENVQMPDGILIPHNALVPNTNIINKKTLIIENDVNHIYEYVTKINIDLPENIFLKYLPKKKDFINMLNNRTPQLLYKTEYKNTNENLNNFIKNSIDYDKFVFNNNDESYKLITFNVHSFYLKNYSETTNLVIDFLSKIEPDILLLQEFGTNIIDIDTQLYPLNYFVETYNKKVNESNKMNTQLYALLENNMTSNLIKLFMTIFTKYNVTNTKVTSFFDKRQYNTLNKGKRCYRKCLQLQQ